MPKSNFMLKIIPWNFIAWISGDNFIAWNFYEISPMKIPRDFFLRKISATLSLHDLSGLQSLEAMKTSGGYFRSKIDLLRSTSRAPHKSHRPNLIIFPLFLFVTQLLAIHWIQKHSSSLQFNQKQPISGVKWAVFGWNININAFFQSTKRKPKPSVRMFRFLRSDH